MGGILALSSSDLFLTALSVSDLICSKNPSQSKSILTPSTALSHPAELTAKALPLKAGTEKCRSELVLSEVEGVNPCIPAGRLSKSRHLCRRVERLTF